MTQWYYALGEAQHGPVLEDQLVELVRSGQLAGANLVWRDGMDAWAPVEQVPELAGHLPSAGVYAMSPAAAPAQAGYPAPGHDGGQAAPLGYAPGSYLNYYQPPQPNLVYAGFWWRFLAAIVDGFILNVAGLVVGFAMGMGMAAAGMDMAAIELAGNVLGLVLGWLYAAFMESSSWQATLGKRACGITVTDMQGRRISFGRATGRHFGKLISLITLLIGYLMQPFTERKQALHDLMAGTLVWKRP